jgi:uncharacterized protein
MQVFFTILKLKNKRVKNILVLGATGKIGKIVTQLAIEYGFKVTAMLPNPLKLNMEDENLKIVQGDILKYEEVKKNICGQNAVLFAVECHSCNSSILTTGTQNIIKAMKEENIERFVCLSRMRKENTRMLFSLKATLLGLRKNFKANAEQELMLQKNLLKYSLIYPSRLSNENNFSLKDITIYELNNIENKHIVTNGKISRKQVAAFMVEELMYSRCIFKSVFIHH